MLKNIKSSYFSEIIFSYMDEGTKLKLIKYNKSLQKNLNINIINYKHFKGSYIIYEQNKIGKEYNGYNDLLIFEGEYLNGQRNGKGKEYYGSNVELIFEGEYLNGKRNGKGKKYWHNTLLFEGEFKNGKRNGKGKEYDYYEGKLLFDGEYLNDKELIGIRYNANGDILENLNHIKGIGKEYNIYNNVEYEGEYLNGQRNGKGKEYNLEGKLIFEGEYLNDRKWTGKGYDPLNNIVY